jgi:uncharacterized membrane protein YeaQ/YmgE (transglycosylase-associated protein family)
VGIIGWIIVGAIIGYIARFLMPGEDPMGCLGTVLLGVAGSFVGGTIANLIAGEGFALAPAGFIGSVIGAMLLLFAMRRMA